MKRRPWHGGGSAPGCRRPGVNSVPISGQHSGQVRGLFASLLLGLWLGPQVSLHAAQCEELPKPSFRLQRLDEPLTTEHHESYRALSGLARQLARPGSEIVGLTRGTAVVDIETRLAIVVDRRTNLECASPQLTVAYGYRPMTVYVAREFPKGSCAHERILDHEMRHVQAYREHLARIEPELSQALRQWLANWQIERRPVGMASYLLRRELNERWIPFIREAISRVEAEQARIDSPEEYQRVTGSCQGAIRNTLTESLRAASRGS